MTWPEIFLTIMGWEYLLVAASYGFSHNWPMAGVLACYGLANFFLVMR